MGYDGTYMMGGLHGMWWLLWLVLILVLVLGGRGRWRNQPGRSQGDSWHDTPHELLHRRLANGDITPAEYEERKLLLDRDTGPRHGKT